MPSLKAERRIRPGSRGLAAALGWLPAGGAPPRRPGLGSSRCWALQLRRPRPPLPGSERTPTPRRRRRVPAARPGLSPTPPRLLPPGTAPPGNGWSCTALPVPAVSQLLHARTQKSETNFKSRQAKQNDVWRENSYSGITHRWESFLSQSMKTIVPCPAQAEDDRLSVPGPGGKEEEELIRGLVTSL
ncbi:immediate early response gene 5-like protein isoform X2 [Mustela nigripes]|uniref:immediate early response gene 5-like protein isoform X2 n=1 Tax=Mustela nigripes TaxID=77151 RepID=UPI002814E3CF|nr:immediate early response gene 5-like protein isoform X2 [Mustela nigripes]